MVLVAAALVWNLAPQPEPPARTVLGSVARVEGFVEVVSVGRPRRLASASNGVSVWSGDLLRTGEAGRVAIDLSSGFVLRMNGQSVVRFVSSEALVLERGTLYVDTGAIGPAPTLEVQTPLGCVRHVGTQYEVHVDGHRIRMRVREGAVVFRDDLREVTADAGEQVTIAAAGELVRTAFAPYDPAWGWVESLAAVRNTGDATVAELLEWVGRERGLTVRYASAIAEAEAARLILHGIEGLTPAEVLEVIEGTTSIRHVVRDGALIVSADPQGA